LAGKKHRRSTNRQQQKQVTPVTPQQETTAAGAANQQSSSKAPRPRPEAPRGSVDRARAASGAMSGGNDVGRAVGGGAGFTPANGSAGSGAPQRPQAKRPGINWSDAGILAVIVLIIALAVIFFAQPIASDLQKQLGIDLQGGVSLTYQASQLTPSTPVTAEAMNSLKNNFEKRVNGLGVTEPDIRLMAGNRIQVELPGFKDPDQAVKTLGTIAKLEFKTEGPDGKTDDGPVVLTGADLQVAKAQIDTSTNEPEVALTFNADGTKKFAQATAANVGKQIGIYLDNQLLTNPMVKEAIPSGNAVISGGYKTLQDAQNDAVLLNAGALPVQVQLLQNQSWGPTLGQAELNRSLMAGVIGLSLVLLFMLLYYRVPGIVADLSLIVYALIMAGIYILFHVTLTLPGIAAFIISVGMAVDANILIYERLKEELRAGKTLRSSFDAGFRHAFRTILDCNVNTLIGACVLLYFGSKMLNQEIMGFAVTLIIGVAVSLFTAITFTRLVLHLIVGSRLVTNPKWYGLHKWNLASALGRVPNTQQT
jgi:preprotein translocase subunit SecD